MRARQRHFPYKAALLSFGYDARYIAGSNGSQISAWENRNGGSALTQPTSTNQPLLQTGTNGINGQNAVKFDGVDDYLSTLIAMGIYNTIIAVGRFTTAKPIVLRHGTYAGYYFSGASDPAWSIPREITHSASGVSQWMGSDNAIVSFVYDGNGKYYKNGVEQDNGTITGTSPVNRRFAGSFAVCHDSVNSKFSDGLLGILILLGGLKNDPLRKRMERASSYSYKIACS
jgi:hypothetical protein